MARKADEVVNQAVEAVASDPQIESLRTEIANLAKQIAGLVAERSTAIGAAVNARVQEGLGQAQAQAGELRAASVESFGHAADRTKDMSAALLDAVSSEVRRNPARTLAVTLGIGLILGMWSRPRH